MERLKVADPRLGLDDDGIAGTGDTGVEGPPIARARERNLETRPQRWAQSRTKCFEERRVPRVTERWAGGIEANGHVQANDRRDPGQVADRHAPRLTPLDSR